MSLAKKALPVTTSGHKAELIKTMQRLAHRHDLWRVFSDFVEMAAVSIANACDTANRDRDAREARYMEMVKAYTREELQEFPRMLGHLTMALEAGMDDVLGQVFMELDLGSKWHGQFFTPYSLCRMIAATNIGHEQVQAEIERKGFITASEPACGGGATIIAMAEELQAAGVNYQQHMHATCQDLDMKAVHMAYVQLSLLHVPAVIIHGNTLANEQRSRWYTPAHVMGGWHWKLRKARQLAADPLPSHQKPEKPPEPVTGWQQSGLF